MKVFMLGWEFPPHISGGLGTACYGLTKAMSELGIEVVFALPELIAETVDSHVRLVGGNQSSSGQDNTLTGHAHERYANIRFRSIQSDAVEAYARPNTGQRSLAASVAKDLLKSFAPSPSCSFDNTLSAGQYSGDLFSEVCRYASSAVDLAIEETFDVVHAHDWMTFPAGLSVAATSGKPLVVHVHSTEFDRSGEHVNQPIYDIEREGMHAADRIIAVSRRTRDMLVDRYAVPFSKIVVAHNGVDGQGGCNIPDRDAEGSCKDRIVLFLGRITMQKGPEYFLQAAKMVLGHMDNVQFIMAGSGDLMQQCVEMAANMGIGHKVLFTGFLRGPKVQQIYQMADLYVMPSVSEPFGIAPLEALDLNIPVLISKQSGVSEVLSHALKVDFWDVQDMADKIIAVLEHPPLHLTLRKNGKRELQSLDWIQTAGQCVQVYEQLVNIS